MNPMYRIPTALLAPYRLALLYSVGLCGYAGKLFEFRCNGVLCGPAKPVCAGKEHNLVTKPGWPFKVYDDAARIEPRSRRYPADFSETDFDFPAIVRHDQFVTVDPDALGAVENTGQYHQRRRQ